MEGHFPAGQRLDTVKNYSANGQEVYLEVLLCEV